MAKLIVINNSCKDSSSLPPERLLFPVRPPLWRKKKEKKKKRKAATTRARNKIGSSNFSFVWQTDHPSFTYILCGSTTLVSRELLEVCLKKYKRQLFFRRWGFYFETVKWAEVAWVRLFWRRFCGGNGYICMKETQEESTVIFLTLGCHSRIAASLLLTAGLSVYRSDL